MPPGAARGREKRMEGDAGPARSRCDCEVPPGARRRLCRARRRSAQTDTGRFPDKFREAKRSLLQPRSVAEVPLSAEFRNASGPSPGALVRPYLQDPDSVPIGTTATSRAGTITAEGVSSNEPDKPADLPTYLGGSRSTSRVPQDRLPLGAGGQAPIPAHPWRSPSLPRQRDPRAGRGASDVAGDAGDAAGRVSVATARQLEPVRWEAVAVGRESDGGRGRPRLVSQSPTLRWTSPRPAVTRRRACRALSRAGSASR